MYKGKTVAVVIPAKGVSKRIPGKNLKSLCGKPLLKWTTDYCLSSLFVDEFYVSSDCGKVLEYAENKCSANIIQEPPDMATEELGTDAVISSALEGPLVLFDYIVMLQPTSPIRGLGMLDSAVKYIVDNPELNAIVSVTNRPSLQWAYWNGLPKPTYDRLNRPRSQELFRWVENGSMYVFKKDAFLKEGTRIVYPVKLWECHGIGTGLDIDNMEDWLSAEAVINYLIESRKILCTP